MVLFMKITCITVTILQNSRTLYLWNSLQTHLCNFIQILLFSVVWVVQICAISYKVFHGYNESTLKCCEQIIINFCLFWWGEERDFLVNHCLCIRCTTLCISISNIRIKSWELMQIVSSWQCLTQYSQWECHATESFKLNNKNYNIDI